MIEPFSTIVDSSDVNLDLGPKANAKDLNTKAKVKDLGLKVKATD